MKQQLAKTIASRVPDKANEILASYGAKKAEGKNLVKQLVALQNKYGEEAVKKLMEIHPDKQAIEHYYEQGMDKEEKSNCGGCSGADGKKCPYADKMSDADGLQKVIAGSTVKEWLPFVAAATFFLGSIIIFSVEYSKAK